MFANLTYRDVCGFIDPGLHSASFSASTTTSSGNLIDAMKFEKFIFAMYAQSTAPANATLTIYSCSTSASSISSASSNWTAITSCSVTMASSLASVSSNRYCAFLEIRGEAINSTSTTVRYIRPVISCGSGVASNSVLTVTGVTCMGLDPVYGPADQQEPSSLYVSNETDFL